MDDNNHEFTLTEKQIRDAINKYGKDYVKEVYRKLSIKKQFEEGESMLGTKYNKVKIDLGNGGFRYKKLKTEG